MPPDHVDDHRVIEASRHTPEAFAEIFERHAPAVHRFLARRTGPEADDLLGEVFVIAFRSRTRYRPMLDDARPWLFGIATNVLRREQRAAASRGRLGSRPADAVADHALDEDALARRVDAESLRPRLGAALAGLAPGDRDALLLLAWEQLSYAEIAVALEIPVGTVRSRIHRARRRLRPLLADTLDDLDATDTLDTTGACS